MAKEKDPKKEGREKRPRKVKLEPMNEESVTEPVGNTVDEEVIPEVVAEVKSEEATPVVELSFLIGYINMLNLFNKQRRSKLKIIQMKIR